MSTLLTPRRCYRYQHLGQHQEHEHLPQSPVRGRCNSEPILRYRGPIFTSPSTASQSHVNTLPSVPSPTRRLIFSPATPKQQATVLSTVASTGRKPLQVVLTPSRSRLMLLTPNRTRVVPMTPPSVRCSHHAKRCPVDTCMKCSQCCEHREMLQLRGGKSSKRQSKRITVLRLNERRSKKGKTTPDSRPPIKLLDIISFLGWDEKTRSYYSRHLPARDQRSQASFWHLVGAAGTKSANAHGYIFNFYSNVLASIAEMVCGSSASSSSLEHFYKWKFTTCNTMSPSGIDIAQAVKALEAAQKGSIERQFIRGTLCSMLSFHGLSRALHDVSGASIGRSAFTSSRNDIQFVIDTGTMPSKHWIRKKFDPVVVDKAIATILSPSNITFLSWGTKRINVDGVFHDVPALLRRRPVHVMFDQYASAVPKPVSRSTFYRLAGLLTHGHMDARRSVDYVTGLLVNDTFQTIANIVNKAAPGKSEEYRLRFDAIRAWLKYGHGSRHSDSEGCPCHDIRFALSTPATSGASQREASCRACRGVRRVFEDLTTLVKADMDHDDSTIAVIKDIYEKVGLFMGHRLRVVNQQLAINGYLGAIKDKCAADGASHTAWVIIDFKMRAEPIYFRETTADHFGKRGMSWHGVMVRCFESEGGEMVEFNQYYDHISATDNAQDKGATLSMVEALLIALKRDLPQIKCIAVQSDKASYYQNSCVMAILPVLGMAHGIRVERYVHTETQDGKSLLDAHLAKHHARCGDWYSKVTTV